MYKKSPMYVALKAKKYQPSILILKNTSDITRGLDSNKPKQFFSVYQTAMQQYTKRPYRIIYIFHLWDNVCNFSTPLHYAYEMS